MKEIKNFIIEYCRNEFVKNERKYCEFLEVEPSIAELYQIGYISDNGLVPVLSEQGYSQEELAELNINDIHNRFIFPSFSDDGEINAFFFKRDELSKQPVWITRIYAECIIYGADKVNKKQNYIMIVDGPSDVIEFANAHIPNAAWCSSIDGLNLKQIEFFKSFENVIIAFDNDDYGQKNSKKISDILLENDINACILDYEGLYINLKESTQRNLIVNQIKTIISKE